MKKARINLEIIISVAVIAAIAIVVGICGDYYFDLNDDVLMKDILSGAYTGAPDGHNIQMLYPVSLFISLLYGIGSNIDWYGIFLLTCQYFCLGTIIYKTLKAGRNLEIKIIAVIAETAVIFGFFGAHLIYVQYTVVCGLLAATAAFAILTSEFPKGGMIDAVISVAMLLIAFLIRSEMLLLMLPMFFVTVLMKFAFSSKVMSFIRLGTAIVIGLVLCLGIHKLAYSSSDWKEFNRFFDNRTELYDFQYIPDYEENKEFYDSIGLSEGEYQLLVNYNFGLDDEIDADVLIEVAEYADSIRGEENPVFTRLKESLVLYLYRLRSIGIPRSYEYPMTDYPWNAGVILLYASAVILALTGYNKLRQLLLLVVLFITRSGLWLFIIYRGRDPVRITHPLYFTEILILLGMILITADGRMRIKTASLVALSLIGIISIPSVLGVIRNENLQREEMLANYGALYDYFRENEDSFFFLDVYSSVSYADEVQYEVATYSEKMFYNVDNSVYNHDILGGWASKSPLSAKKLEQAGLFDVQTALISDGVYFVQTLSKDTSWLYDYYRDKGIEIKIEKTGEIADLFAIYDITRVQ